MKIVFERGMHQVGRGMWQASPELLVINWGIESIPQWERSMDVIPAPELDGKIYEQKGGIPYIDASQEDFKSGYLVWEVDIDSKILETMYDVVPSDIAEKYVFK